MEDGIVELEAMTYMRGRSIPKTWIIADENQNASPAEMKTMLTRAGKDTKIILLADPSQIDTPYLDKESCGITHVIDAFKGSSVSLEDSVKKAAEFVKSLSDTLSKGVIQTVNASVGVDVTGAAPGANKDFLDGLGALIKPYFEAYYKEATGKDPKLVPTAK
jgi:hypothetical protein